MNKCFFLVVFLCSFWLCVQAQEEDTNFFSKERVVIERMKTRVDEIMKNLEKKSEKEIKQDIQKQIKVAIRSLSAFRKKYSSTMQFDKSKEVKKAIDSLKKKGLTAEISFAEIKKKPKEIKKIPSYWRTVFTEGLTDSNGRSLSIEKLDGKFIGLFFSAHWCKPCRTFARKLVNFRDKNKKDFEVVFISSDVSVKAQKNYMAEMKMKWGAVKFKKKDQNALFREYHVGGVTRLVILDAKGNLVTQKGRADVENNPEGCIEGWAR